MVLTAIHYVESMAHASFQDCSVSVVVVLVRKFGAMLDWQPSVGRQLTVGIVPMHSRLNLVPVEAAASSPRSMGLPLVSRRRCWK